MPKFGLEMGSVRISFGMLSVEAADREEAMNKITDLASAQMNLPDGYDIVDWEDMFIDELPDDHELTSPAS